LIDFRTLAVLRLRGTDAGLFRRTGVALLDRNPVFCVALVCIRFLAGLSLPHAASWRISHTTRSTLPFAFALDQLGFRFLLDPKSV
jgi:hypothetical protein